MNSQAVLFPGQGSQRAGMGLDFKEKYSEAAEVFVSATTTLGWDVAEMCRGEDPRLDLTEFTQPCILTVEIAMFRALQKHYSFAPNAFAGHSLGEYTALVAAGAIPLESALRLVSARGRFMQNCIAPGGGAMVAVIMTNLELEEIGKMATALKVDIANDNSSNQVVVSGQAEPVAELSKALQSRFSESIRLVPLAVSAPFHSRWMANAQEQFGEVLRLEAHHFDVSKATRVLSNFSGKNHTGRLDDLSTALINQISGRVRWRENLAMVREQCDSLVEVGPTRPLSGFCKTMGFPVNAVIDYRSADRAFAAPAVEASL